MSELLDSAKLELDRFDKFSYATSSLLLKRIAELETQLAEARKDAERYQYVRNSGWELIGDDRGNGPEWPDCEELDALVDKALAGGSE